MQSDVSKNIHQILKKHWGYETFREKQEDIINSILSEKDTLALLPTGGGKSICFQVPALAKDGIAIVITPLIALMQDQVDQLKKVGIKALAIHSNLTKREIDIALDNAIYGNYKFLYLSPERLETELFQVRLRKMNINFIVVDEAHCISQWGYDFRPSYLKIALLRDLLPDTSILALTATATPEVVEDIQTQLRFRQKHVIEKSFKRDNLIYVVQETENPMVKLMKVIGGVKGSGIIYVNSRKKTATIANALNKQGISSTYYNGGLDYEERKNRQKAWINNQAQVMVATNAFGMGIDKADVRFVVHIDAPESLEAYFQEAGRAGRDGKKAYAVMLKTPALSATLLDKFDQKFPSIDRIKSTYTALHNYFQIPIGSGKLESFELDLVAFSDRYQFNLREALVCMKFLQKEGYLEYNERGLPQSKLQIILTKENLYKFQVAHQAFDPFIKTLLRTYGGLFEDVTIINESQLAKNMNLPVDKVNEKLKRLSEMEVIEYMPKSKLPTITLLLERLNDKSVTINKKRYQSRKKIIQDQIESVIHYMNANKCRSQLLLEYFDEETSNKCGRCDYCLMQQKKNLQQEKFNQIKSTIIEALNKKDLLISELMHLTQTFEESDVKETISFMMDEEIIEMKQQKISLT